MANIKIRRGSGVPSGLTFGEPAFDITNSRLYVGITGGSALVGVAGGGVHSFNGLTGAVTGVTTGNANTFGPLQSFTTGISASGGSTLANLRTNSLTVGDTVNARITSSPDRIQGYFSTEANPRFEINRDMLASGQAGIGFNDTSGTIVAAGGAVGVPTTRTLGFYTSNGASLVQRVRIDPDGQTNILHPLNAIAGLCAAGSTFTAITRFTSGICASGGITLSGNLSATTASFSGLMVSTAGISGNGATFSSYLNALNFRAARVGGDEGGQIDFDLPATGTTLIGGVAMDIFQNRVRIFETGGSNRGVFIDLSGVSAGVGTNLIGGGGGGGAVSSVSGSGNGISVSPTTGAVVIQNTGVHSFNGLTGDVTGVTTGTSNTFGLVQNFTSGISASGITVGVARIIGTSLRGGNGFTIRGSTLGSFVHNEIDLPAVANSVTISSATGVINFDSGLASKTVDYSTGIRLLGYNSGLASPTSTTLVVAGGAGNTVSMPSISGTLALVGNVVTSFNGLTGSVTGVTTGTANTFGPLQSFINGISSSGGTFGTLRVEQPNIATLNVRSSAGGGSVNITTNQGNCGSIGSTNNIPFVFTTNGADRVLISSDGNIGIRTTNPGATLDVVGTFRASQLSQFTGGLSAAGGITFNSAFTGSTATFNGLIISTAGFSGTGITLSGNLSAATKSFVIPHPTKPGKKLQYASLEGPENGVYVRGRLIGSNTIDLPDYWPALVYEDSITVTLTAYGSQKNYFVKSIENNQVIVGSKSKDIDCFYLVQAERKDVPRLIVEA